MPLMMKSARWVCNDGISSANGVSLQMIFTPIRFAISFARSMSRPTSWSVAGSRYSMGAYVELTVSRNAPACLIVSGNSAAGAAAKATSTEPQLTTRGERRRRGEHESKLPPICADCRFNGRASPPLHGYVGNIRRKRGGDCNHSCYDIVAEI